jgi:hypothetical protein
MPRMPIGADPTMLFVAVSMTVSVPSRSVM